MIVGGLLARWVQFKGIYAHRKAHICPTLSPKSFLRMPMNQLRCLSDWRLPLSLPVLRRSCGPPVSMSLSSRRSVVWRPWFCSLRVVSQAPQHFTPSATEATFDVGLLCPPVYVLGHFLCLDDPPWKDGEGHRPEDLHWNCFKSTTGEISEIHIGAFIL